MADSASSGPKRKHPPTFHHYPTNRAKALKKAWVEKTKIKSKWKAEKRKEDLASNYKLEIPVYSDDDGPNVPQVSTSQPESPSTSSAPAHLHHSRAHIHPELPVKPHKSVQPDTEPRPAKRRKILKGKDEDKSAESVSLRELTREAYSRSTLHTFKADPLKKRYDGKDKNNKRGASTGRGQPNMKLRMNAMLAKIKQDFA
ncbi:hypothetical protein JR316_0003462 [Psilocybe cubensis]|uniref:Uncharacterized protein n=2 Tax=Psilocybe cubensis TaxID=181762 RepID=A0ACB8H820_PSICU|nr:hypothetical protein JR316_0003462 [Psilocybe cubensis]KAH9483984.1 hypothetical protein JR316_0003462 [Psilocybe cubensis]